MLKKTASVLSLLCLTFWLTSCGIIDYIYLPPGEDTAQELFENGNDAVRNKDYTGAAMYFTKLKDNFPFSPYALEAELSLADCYYLSKEWGEASEAYKEFETMHPRHEAIPYVLYNIGQSNLNGYPSIDRPTGQIEEAYSYFRRLTESYPGTEYAEGAIEKMAECRKTMAEHELYVADFYYRMEKYGSALIRYRQIMKDFPDVEEVYNHAELKANAAFVNDREQGAEQTRLEREGSWKDWFNWL